MNNTAMHFSRDTFTKYRWSHWVIIHHNVLLHCDGSEVLTAVFWDATPCSPVKLTDVSEVHTASIFRVRVSQASSYQEAGGKQSPDGYFLDLLFDPLLKIW
jgi:hypothetical protein